MSPFEWARLRDIPPICAACLQTNVESVLARIQTTMSRNPTSGRTLPTCNVTAAKRRLRPATPNTHRGRKLISSRQTLPTGDYPHGTSKMPGEAPSTTNPFVKAISDSKLTIYDAVEVGHPELWIPARELERILEQSLLGTSLAGLPLRTRSKKAKQLVCAAMGYPVPKSFRRASPDFPGQCVDLYVQKSNNLQIWNEGVSPTRRYALFHLDADDIVRRVRVINGADLAKLDTTGTLTKKHQAKLVIGDEECELISAKDSDRLIPFLNASPNLSNGVSPVADPRGKELLPVETVYRKLCGLIGTQFPDAGADQERNRGAGIHRHVCRRLGYQEYRDDGRFPDVRHQLIEVKLQTAPTIDLGLVSPNSEDLLDLPKLRIGGEGEDVKEVAVRHCDVRYAIFYGEILDGVVTIMHFFLVVGKDFFGRFKQFQGNVMNAKLQIRLPNDFFEEGTTDRH